MDSIYVLIPVTFLLLGIAVAAYLWSVDSGQFEDLDKAAHSILYDEDPGATPPTGSAPEPASEPATKH